MKPVTSFSAHAARGENSGWRYLLTLAVAPVLAIAFAVVVGVTLQLMRRLPADFAARVQDPRYPLSFFGFNGAAFLLVLAAFVLAIRVVHRKRFGDVVGAWTWRQFALGFAVWAAVLIVGALIDWALAPGGFRFSATPQTPILAAAAFGALAVQTFTEEFVFRGYLTQGLWLATGRTAPTAVISGLLFGALHIPNGAPQAANAVVFGVALALIAMRTGGIAFTHGLHLANNLFGAVIIVSSGDAFHGSPGLFTQNTPGLMWWDAAVGALALTAVTVAVHRVLARRDKPARPSDAIIDG